MMQSLLLPWFPVLLGVGVGGRLLGRARGFGLGLICALFWIALVQSTLGLAVWANPWSVLTLIFGALAVVMIGGWAGESASADATHAGSTSPAGTAGSNRASPGGQEAASGSRRPFAQPLVPNDAGYKRLTIALERFRDWLPDRSTDTDPWPQFGEFVRGILYECCQATHVKPYRVVAESNELRLLRAAFPPAEPPPIPARGGVLGHVITTGRAYVAGDATQGELMQDLAREAAFDGAWCFAITSGAERLGVVSVGRTELDPMRDRALMRTVEQLVTQFWLHVQEAVRGRAAGDDDPVSHVLNRQAFFESAERVLSECYARGEPAALAVVNVLGLRQLHDVGRWDLADCLVQDVGGLLRRKVRVDDRVGRFDGSRFVWLLRCVDSDLARLIVSQVVNGMSQVVGDHEADVEGAGARIRVCCGLTGAGLDHPSLRSLVARALVQAQRARTQGLPVATDLDARRPPAAAGPLSVGTGRPGIDGSGAESAAVSIAEPLPRTDVRE